MCYNSAMDQGNSQEQFGFKYELPKTVLSGLMSPGAAVNFRTTYKDDRLGDTPREQNVHILVRKDSSGGGGFSIDFVRAGVKIGAFAISDDGEVLHIVHRKVNPHYQGFGIASRAIAIVESVAAEEGKAVEVDVAEPDVDSDSDVNGIQLDTLSLLKKHGYVLADPASKKVASQLQKGVGFRFVEQDDSGPKAIPLNGIPISLVMRKNFN